ncbi:hypothetical protein ACFW16_33495 [Inquilinus sp. NPDC058860]|uniref:hypothetical protein n=1 Tax=Inquilinus sp. NPDC058860 TaxID=3346652 RepID=UPI0036BE05DE
MRRSLCLAFGLGMLAAGPAWAQATAEEAAKLKAVLEAWVPSGEDLTPAEADYIVEKLPSALVVGRWRVEPDGDGYRIQSPGVRVVLARGFEQLFGRTVLACDPDRMRAAPTGAGTFALSGDAALSCRLERVDGSILPITAERGRSTGSIDLRDPASVSTEAVLDRVTVGGGAGEPAKIDRLILSGGRKAAANGRSDVTGRYTLEGFSSPSPSGTGTIAAARITYDVAAESADIAASTSAAIALAKRLAGLIGDAARSAGDDPAVQALQDTLIGSSGRASRQEVRVEGLVTRTPARTLEVDAIALGAAMSDLDRSGARLTMRLDIGGTAFEPPTPYTAWIPSESTAQLTIEDMPLWQIVGDSMLPGKRDPAAVSRLVSESSMRVRIDAFHLAAPEAALDLGGTIASARDAVRGQTGNLQMRLTGIDALVKALQADPKAGQAAAGLSVLQVLGRQTTLPDGRSARDYEIVIDPSGKVLVNGADVQALVPKDL